MSKKKYILYDARAMGSQGTDDATVLCCADTVAEYKRDARDFGYELAIYQYDVRGKELVNEEWIDDYYPDNGFVSEMD